MFCRPALTNILYGTCWDYHFAVRTWRYQNKAFYCYRQYCYRQDKMIE